MKRTLAIAIGLSLIVSFVVHGTAGRQSGPAPKTIVQLVRDAIAANDFTKAEKLVLGDMAENGTTPIAIEAFSWLGRGYVAAKRYDEAMTYAARTYEIVEEQLKTRSSTTKRGCRSRWARRSKCRRWPRRQASDPKRS